MLEISLQTSGVRERYGADETFAMIKEAGFDGVDWSLDQGWDRTKIHKKIIEPCIYDRPFDEALTYYRDDIDAAHKYGLKIFQAHAPFPAYVKDFPELNDYAIKVIKQCIHLCGEAGVKNLVVHGISLAIDDDTQTPESIREMNMHLYESLIPDLLETGVSVCLENLFTGYKGMFVEGVCSVPEEAVYYIDTLNKEAGKECFGFCLDTGHLNLLGKRQDVFIKKLGKRIKILHLHDNRGDADEHLAPYTGNIVWNQVTDALKDIGYTGNLNFETFAQVDMNRLDDEDAVMAYLRLISDIGAVFRKKIEA